jgi:hypothetical protein
MPLGDVGGIGLAVDGLATDAAADGVLRDGARRAEEDDGGADQSKGWL